MAFRQFGLFLLIRLIFLMLGVYVFIFLFNDPRYHAATLLMFLILLALTYEMWRFINKTNRETSRFLAAARYADFGQQFEFENSGGGFEELGKTFTDILDRLHEQRLSREQESRHLRAMIEHIPSPLISVHSNGSVLLRNNAARRLFGITPVINLEDFRKFGEDCYSKIRDSKAGEKQLIHFDVDEMNSQLLMSVTQVISGTGSERLISLQDIGNELETTQLKAWQDLVRVLTHEIMNSITPVSSLAQTTVDMVDDVNQQVDDGAKYKQLLHDIRQASSTVARRSTNLMQFVANYRKLTKLPTPEKIKVNISELFEQVVRLLNIELSDDSIEVVTDVSPVSLEVYADRELIEQTLINLIQNSRQELLHRSSGTIKLLAHLNKRGRTTIEVHDNGRGISPRLLKKVFVPYFTTKPDGNGIGLALARQVMVSHGGFISVSNLESGGARFSLTF